mmetsp:Transcript_31428/g.70000  ORF Transcript_31428/g.70000 Transcript_31428/m.70000 type:complete len:91 (-) Transcript_31428:1098-1370(-)
MCKGMHTWWRTYPLVPLVSAIRTHQRPRRALQACGGQTEELHKHHPTGLPPQLPGGASSTEPPPQLHIIPHASITEKADHDQPMPGPRCI